MFTAIIVLLVGSCFCSPEDLILDLYGRQIYDNIFDDKTEELNYEFFSPVHIEGIDSVTQKFKRSTEHLDELFLSINAFGENFKILLHKTEDILAKEAEFTERYDNGSIFHRSIDDAKGCYYSGYVISHGNSPVSMSTCDGLTGLMTTRTDDYLIQELPNSIRSKRSEDHDQYIIYKRARGFPISSKLDKKETHVPNLKPIRKIRQAQNAVNAKKLTIEVAIFIDFELFKYYQRIFPQDTENIILKLFLAIINGAQQLYNDPSLTNKKVVFVVIKFEIFKSRMSFANKFGNKYWLDFCLWQSTQNVLDDKDPRHWDHAYMFIGTDMYLDDGRNQANGLAGINVMCDPVYSCALCNGRGLVTVFTAAHESGHTFGMEHDSEGNDCKLPANFMMSGGEHVRPWSRCSRQYFENYLTLPQSVCLLDDRTPTPQYNHEKNNNVWIGQCYDFDQQCELSQGPGFYKDPQQSGNDACNFLNCISSEGAVSQGNSHSAYQGSPCGSGMWCFNRKCVSKPSGVKDVPNGKWNNFQPIGSCKSSCIQGAVGFVMSRRTCLHPTNKDLFAKCQGPSTLVEKCDDSRVCSRKKSIDEFIQDSCRKHIKDGATGKGEQANHDQTGGCLIWCFRKNDGMSYEAFPDGTPCGNQSQHYCLNRKCTKI